MDLFNALKRHVTDGMIWQLFSMVSFLLFYVQTGIVEPNIETVGRLADVLPASDEV